MKIEKTFIKDLLVIKPEVFGDNRGWFYESFSTKEFKKMDIDICFVQDNHSYSAKKDIIRGLHCQIEPHSQTKLVRCTRGKIVDYAVDMRRSSKTFKKWFSIELSEENKLQILIPKGFLHGFKTLTENVEIEYKVDDFYFQDCDRSVRYDDKEIGINWDIKNPIISKKDADAPLLSRSDINFK